MTEFERKIKKELSDAVPNLKEDIKRVRASACIKNLLLGGNTYSLRLWRCSL